jgi:hypothetical protein
MSCELGQTCLEGGKEGSDSAKCQISFPSHKL